MEEEEPGFVQRVLRDYREDPALVVSGIAVSAGSSVGDNYMSVVESVVAKGTTGAGHPFTEQLVVKRWPRDAERRRLFRVEQAFRREALAYSWLLPALGGQAAALCPQCLLADADQGVVVLRDLRPLGFRMADRKAGLDLPHATLTVQALARFHAQSLAFEHRDPTAALKLRSELSPDLVYDPEAEQMMGLSLENSLRMATAALEGENNEQLAEVLATITRLRGRVFETMGRLLTDTADDTAVACHGDSNVNNLLFKYDEDGRPAEVRLLDLQVMRFASLASDLLYLLPGVQDEVRDRHLLHLLHCYLSELRQSAAGGAAGITMERLKEEVRRLALWGLVSGLWVLPAMTIDPRDVPSMEGGDSLSENAIQVWSQCLGEDYKRRARSLLASYRQWKQL